MFCNFQCIYSTEISTIIIVLVHGCTTIFTYLINIIERNIITQIEIPITNIIIVGKLICFCMVCTSRQWCACCLLTRQHHIQDYLQE